MENYVLMLLEYSDSKLGAVFNFSDFIQQDRERFRNCEEVISIIWNRNQETVNFLLDGALVQLLPNQLTTVTYFQQIEYLNPQIPLIALLFNKEFYCIADHDNEVSCNGILFFGTQDLPIITIYPDHNRKFQLLLEVIIDEFKTVDNIQGEMLQMLLKRFIIICTRLAREQLIIHELSDGQIDIIRQFNVLVDLNYKTKRKVKEYADLMHRSPKTLSNLFAIYNQKSPLQIIQERVVLEAKRLMLFSDKQTQEIAFDLGFEDPAYFSRYFKKVAKVSPSEFKLANV